MPAETDLAAAVAALLRGELVAFPTETVYGLGANAADPAALARLYATKGRPADHPVIVHIARSDALAYWAREIPPAAQTLAARFWPGPLTLVLPRAAHVLDAVTGGQDTVAVRCPAHPLALRLLRDCDAAGVRGLVAPSANRFGRISPTDAAHVEAEFGDSLAAVLDGGPCAVGIESTIVDCAGIQPRVLRPGMVTEAEIATALGAPLGRADAGAPRVSGALPAHYAPRTPLKLLPAEALLARAKALLDTGQTPAVLAFGAVCATLGSTVSTLLAPALAADYARTLYRDLRRLDTLGAAEILVETPPGSPAWRGIQDRLERAARGAAQAQDPGPRR